MAHEELLKESFVRASQGLDHGVILHYRKRIVFANDYISNLLETPSSKLIGKSPYSLLSEKEQERILTKVSKRSKTGNIHDKYYSTVVSSSGKRIPVMISVFMIELSGKKYTAKVITNQSDINRTQRKLEESEEKYRRFFSRSPVALFRTDERGRLVECNTAFDELMETNSCIGKKLSDFFDSQKDKEEFLNNLRANEVIDNHEISIRTQRENLKLVSVSAVYYPEQERTEGVIIDISERKLNEEKIRHLAVFDSLITKLSTHFIELPTEEIDQGIHFALRAISEFANVDAGFILTFDGPVRQNLEYYTSNRNQKQIASMKKALEEKPFPKIRSLINQGAVIRIDDVEQIKEISLDEHARLSKEGLGSFICMPMMRENDVIGILGFAFFQKSHHWTDEMVTVLRVSSEMFTNALFRKNIDEQVNSLYESQSKLFSQIAHSLKTPFTVALSNLELLKTSTDAENRTIFIDYIKESILESSAIVGQLLKIAHMDLFPVGSSHDSFSSQELLSEIFTKGKALLKSHYNDISPKEIEDSFQLTKNQEGKISGDKRAFAEAILIVIDNAFVHSPLSDRLPRVTLAGTVSEGKLKIMVKDQGKGIPKREIPKLFDIYYQGTGSGGGSGIGLAFCKKIVESQGGEVVVRSKLNSGTTVTILVPLKE